MSELWAWAEWGKRNPWRWDAYMGGCSCSSCCEYRMDYAVWYILNEAMMR